MIRPLWPIQSQKARSSKTDIKWRGVAADIDHLLDLLHECLDTESKNFTGDQKFDESSYLVLSGPILAIHLPRSPEIFI
jgi:hypothetical protein